MTRKGNNLPYSIEKQPTKSKKYQQTSQSVFEKVILPTPKPPKTSKSLTILLSLTAVFTISSIDWNIFHDLFFPKLKDFHDKHNIEKLAVHRQRREANKQSSFVTSHDPSMNFILQDVKEIPLDEWNRLNKNQAVQKGKNFTKYLYPSSEFVPLNELERIYVTTGYHGLRAC